MVEFFFGSQGGQLPNPPFIVTAYAGTFMFPEASTNGYESSGTAIFRNRPSKHNLAYLMNHETKILQ